MARAVLLASGSDILKLASFRISECARAAPSSMRGMAAATKRCPTRPGKLSEDQRKQLLP